MDSSRGQFLSIIILLVFIQMLTVFRITYAQQKVQFTQYMYDGSLINPAYVGADEALSLTFINRNQWTGIDGAPTTQTLSAHTLFAKKQLGVGILIHHEKIGVHQNFNLSSNYAYHLKVGMQHYLSLGLQAGIHTRRSDYGSIAGSNPDPLVTQASVSDTYFDMGFGFYFRGPKLHIGLSVPEIIPKQFTLSDDTNMDINEVNQFLFVRYSINVGENLEVQPGFLLKRIKGLPLSYDLNFITTFRKVLGLGVSYRKSESLDFLMRLHLTSQLQLGYAYDFPIGNIAGASNGSHEIMGRYIFKFKQSNVVSPR
ncbi:membrane protein [Marivirga lumbricoides]|uniref:Membrane protein n=1 Tax=Marivirga lumbricoides TaxID=1046115 RepID=A0ABQ1M660_9BACT|nr:membrane protein [Marivirga lumbricoides]